MPFRHEAAFRHMPACFNPRKLHDLQSTYHNMKSLLLIPLAIGSLFFTSCATQTAACPKCAKSSCCENCAKPGGCKADCKCCKSS